MTYHSKFAGQRLGYRMLGIDAAHRYPQTAETTTVVAVAQIRGKWRRNEFHRTAWLTL